MITKVIWIEALAALVHVLCDVIPQLTDPMGLRFCRNITYTKVCSYVVTMFCSYFALWLRTYAVFYRKKIVKQFLSAFVRFIHVLSLVLLVILQSSILVIESWQIKVSFLLIGNLANPSVYYADDCSCVRIELFDDNSIFNIARWAYYFVTTFALELSFLFSFIYPLYLHRKKMHHRGFENVKSIMPAMKRAAIVGIILIVSDLLLVAIVTILQIPNLRVDHIATSINLLINVIATIMSFANWREKLFPYNIDDCRSRKTYG